MGFLLDESRYGTTRVLKNSLYALETNIARRELWDQRVPIDHRCYDVVHWPWIRPKKLARTSSYLAHNTLKLAQVVRNVARKSVNVARLTRSVRGEGNRSKGAFGDQRTDDFGDQRKDAFGDQRKDVFGRYSQGACPVWRFPAYPAYVPSMTRNVPDRLGFAPGTAVHTPVYGPFTPPRRAGSVGIARKNRLDRPKIDFLTRFPALRRAFAPFIDHRYRREVRETGSALMRLT